MKIYNEVIIDMNNGEIIYEDSFEHNGPVALCHTGDHKGSDKLAKADMKIGAAANTTMNLLKEQFKKMSNPETSFFGKELKRITGDITAQKSEAGDAFKLKQDQARKSQQLASSQGTQSQASMVAEQKASINQAREKSAEKAEETRAKGAESAYAAMSSGGMAGGGGRGRKTLAASLKRSMGGMALELKQAKESSEQAMASGEQKMMQERTAGAMSAQQSTETAEQGMNQQRGALDRQLVADTARLKQEQSQGLDSLRMEAASVVASTVGSFQNSYSTWDNRTTDFSEDPLVEKYFPLPTEAT